MPQSLINNRVKYYTFYCKAYLYRSNLYVYLNALGNTSSSRTVTYICAKYFLLLQNLLNVFNAFAYDIFLQITLFQKA